jgi:acyl-[acyl-carrier-protein]-phospholipid O-acyltransferase / long-chain-fatty-acid--[acyl-carrier-protein] ligase
MSNTSGFDLTNHFPAAGDAAPLHALPPFPEGWNNLAQAFVVQAMRTPDAFFLGDKSGVKLTYGQALNKVVELALKLSFELDESKCVGVFAPPMVPAPIVNIALTLLGRVAVNLNYTNQAITDSAIKQCKITQVIGSSEASKALKVKPGCAVINLEELPDRKGTDLGIVPGTSEEQATVAGMLAALMPGMQAGLDDPATVLFSTGSTGDPKGIMLSHRNILSNALATSVMAGLKEREVIMGVLPYFHSFGFTITFWTMAVLGKGIVLYSNALEPREVGKLLEQYEVTLMACTPSVFRHYVKRCTREQFKSVRMLLLGSEKVKPELARDCEAVLGVVPVEGYGMTELGPLCSANLPVEVTTPDGRTVPGNKLGSVGQPVPGTTVKIVDIDTGKVLPPGKDNQGIIFVHGPQVMLGYLNNPQATAEVLRNGWLCTMDVGYMDEDGFLYITDRLSRFAKIGGEMVPIVNVEVAVCAVAGVTEENVNISAIPDADRGERLIVLYVSLGSLSPGEVTDRLNATEMSKLWIPKSMDFFRVDKLPIAPTGKLDLRECKALALLKVGERDNGK